MLRRKQQTNSIRARGKTESGAAGWTCGLAALHPVLSCARLAPGRAAWPRSQIGAVDAGPEDFKVSVGCSLKCQICGELSRSGRWWEVAFCRCRSPGRASNGFNPESRPFGSDAWTPSFEPPSAHVRAFLCAAAAGLPTATLSARSGSVTDLVTGLGEDERDLMDSVHADGLISMPSCRHLGG